MALQKTDNLASAEYVQDFIRLAVNERRTLNPGEVANYSIPSIVGATNAEKYNLLTLQPSAWVKDTAVGSPTVNMDVEASATIAIGVNYATGMVRFVNTHSMPLEVFIRVSVTRKIP